MTEPLIAKSRGQSPSLAWLFHSPLGGPYTVDELPPRRGGSAPSARARRCRLEVCGGPRNGMRLNIISRCMILLSAFRLDSSGRYSYRLEPAKGAPVATDDQEVVVEALLALGVENPDRLIAHARTWGSVEIVEPAQGLSA
jgi:hypothetical protein